MQQDVIDDADKTDEELVVDLEESNRYAKAYEDNALRLLDEAQALRENRDRCRVRSGKLRKLIARGSVALSAKKLRRDVG